MKNAKFKKGKKIIITSIYSPKSDYPINQSDHNLHVHTDSVIRLLPNKHKKSSSILQVGSGFLGFFFLFLEEKQQQLNYTVLDILGHSRAGKPYLETE